MEEKMRIYNDWHLTVIIRNISPLIFLQEPADHRSVRIDLTPEQCAKLKFQMTGINSGDEIYEAISSCFLERDS